MGRGIFVLGKTFQYLIFTILLLLVSSCGDEETPNQISEPDVDFVIEAGIRLEEFIRMGNLASHRGENNEVRSFAQAKVSILNSRRLEIRRLANLYDIPYSQDLRPQKQINYQSLAGMYGYEFDSTYIHHQVLDHIEVKELIEEYINNSSHRNVRIFALTTLSELNITLESAQVLKNRLYRR